MEEEPQSSILVVDDSKINIRIVSNMVADLGHEVHVAHSGIEALKFLVQIKPSLILMDISMPNMSGFDCCRRIKKSASRANIPIIFMSGSNDPKDIQTAKGLGAKGYLIKPLNQAELKKEIQFNMPWQNTE